MDGESMGPLASGTEVAWMKMVWTKVESREMSRTAVTAGVSTSLTSMADGTRSGAKSDGSGAFYCST